jgi:hypothetical protein
MESVDPAWKGLYKWGGVSAMSVGVLYIVSFALAMVMGVVPTGVEAILNHFAAHMTVAYAFYGLAILTDILLVPVALALYLALKGINKSAVLAATGFGGLFLALDLGVTMISWVATITLSQNYAAATSDMERAAYLAAASYANAVVSVSVPVYGGLLPSVWGLILSLVMLKGIFTRATAYVGMATNVVGFVYAGSLFVSALASVDIVWLGLLVIWLLLAGFRLYRLGTR